MGGGKYSSYIKLHIVISYLSWIRKDYNMASAGEKEENIIEMKVSDKC